MNWQDIVLSVGQWIFTIVLIPAILSKEKPPVISSLPTALIMYTFVIVYISLSLWTAAISSMLLGTTWLILTIQKYYQNKYEKFIF
jgi:hypothetical protein